MTDGTKQLKKKGKTSMIQKLNKIEFFKKWNIGLLGWDVLLDKSPCIFHMRSWARLENNVNYNEEGGSLLKL